MFATPSRIPKTSTFVWLSPDEIKHASLRFAHQYWTQIRKERLFPAREDMRTRDIAGLLPYISLVKVIDGGADFEHRVVGDVVVRGFDVPIQNRRFSDIAAEAPKMIETALGLFRQAVESRAPLAWRQITGRDTAHIVFNEAEMVLLPLGKDDSSVDHVVCFTAHASSVAPKPSFA